MIRLMMLLTLLSPTTLIADTPPPGAVGEMPTTRQSGSGKEVPPSICTPDVNPWGFPSACECPEGFRYDPQTGVCRDEQGLSSPAGSLSGSYPRNGSCSDATAKLRLEIWHYQGGVAPPPFMVVERRSLYRGDERIGYVERTEEGRETGIWPVDLEAVSDTKVELESQGTPAAGTTTYAIRLRATNVETQIEEIDTFVICQDNWAMLP